MRSFFPQKPPGDRSRRRPDTPWKSALLLISAVITAATGFVLANGPAISADQPAADGDFVSGVMIEHEIDFGDSIRVQLLADVTENITEVRAVFAPIGVRRVSSYAYPQFTIFSNGETLRAEFAIRTGGSAYFPPGTEFEVFFELTDTAGEVTRTSTERILYLDPDKDWQLLESPATPLDFYYYGFSEGVANSLEERVSSSWLEIAEATGVDTEAVQRFRAIIYPNVREMTPVFPPTSAAATDGTFFGGFAMHRFGLFVLGGPNEDSVVHELTHLLIDTRVNSTLSPGVPSWLHEGLAQYFEAGTSAGYTARLATAASYDSLLTLRNRNTVPARRDEIGLFYTQVGSFIGELIEEFGPEPMANTLGLIDDGQDAASAIETAYGKPLWQLENEWRTRLGASELPPPPQPTATAQDPGENATTIPATEVAAQPTSEATIGEVGVSASDDSPADDESGDGFNWTGPLIGAAAAGIVFFIWSVRVNRRRFRTRRR